MANRAPSRIASIEIEEALIDRIRLRDQEALAEIYDRFASTVYSIALRVLREESVAEEVMQAVFLHVWRNPDEYSFQRGPLWARLVLIGRNRAIDTLRGRKSERAMDDVVVSSRVNFGDLPEWNCTLEEMRQAMESLPAIQRRMLDCALFEGLTLVEIAASRGEPLTTVKAHIRCALLSLRNAVHEGEGKGSSLRLRDLEHSETLAGDTGS